jgi:hypothetical protein
VGKAKSDVSDLLHYMERETGIEPVTSSLGSWRSTAELLPPANILPHVAHPVSTFELAIHHTQTKGETVLLDKTNSAAERDIQPELMHADFYFRTPSEPGPPPIKEPPPEGPAEPGYPEPDPDPTEPSQI